MRAPDRLAEFIQAGLAAGHTPADLAAALRKAGWPQPQVDTGLADWMSQSGLPPVPRPTSRGQARAVLWQALGLAALAVLCWQLVALGFGLVEHVTRDTRADWYSGAGMRWPISVLVVMAPVFALLHLRDGEVASSRRSLAMISGFLAGMGILGSAVAVVHAVLSGELTARFALKAAVVVLVALLVMLTYRSELMRGEEGTGRRSGRAGAWGLIGLAGFFVMAGIWATGGPQAGRAEQRDAARILDLHAIGAQARCLVGAGSVVPPIVATSDCPDLPRLEDAGTGEAYLVELRRSDSLRLCARLEMPAASWMAGEAGPGCLLVPLADLRARPGGAGLVPPDGGILAP